MQIDKVALPHKWLDYIERRGLTKQFQKATTLICQGYAQEADLKIRQPKSEGIYYFRINRQFRARCTIENKTLLVFHIDNHQ